ncbi:MAG: hypothetical protein E6Q76_05700 [Rhizobium sp.]|nr:MAG: hypothetical protein E6Q76_05700 [Rhizobium sp.]
MTTGQITPFRVHPLRLTITETDAVIRRDQQSGAVLAKVLGRRVTEHDEWVYLDRLVHRPTDTAEGWSISGAVSTVLRRPLRSEVA